MRRVFRRMLTAVAVFATVTAAGDQALAENIAATAVPRIAIIIDDLGYQMAAGRRVIDLPGAITCAMLPAAPGTTLLARHANASGKEVLLHLPMQAVHPVDQLEPYGMTMDMSRQSFADTFERAFASVPYAIGVNNHRGSLLTRHPGHMQWLMEEILERDALFFVDSYTTHESVALEIAMASGVPALKRDVFLDSHPEPDSVAREFERLKALARVRGSAVAIGHPYEATLAYLESALPRLAGEGIELVPISELLATRMTKARAAKSGGAQLAWKALHEND